ncbi:MULTISPECIES: aminotransferase class IV family protein [unclassified Solwaraspora]|uniref:aminotransferase class IV family protein n=1 Tax=unclassified Solwaraspora TaxID=2627926 RepID=UPI00248C309E|nr:MULTISPECIES: aminotransferase class IV family protein [unclassified Solwaraspora]WBB99380.1 aminotransferase class IV family protein [Solwaraspora sp. WMMA2059]WBC22070.1 aminotransferase class IV family protein [Solwaraspora sp. WMMA2080]WJK35883.1 aminotransferase class IV family protein [Solwaraspora sp. WMMA2065]
MLLNGQPVDLDHLKILGLTNYGHFTSMRVDAGRVRGLALHLDRLTRDCRALFGAELDQHKVRSYVRHVVGSAESTVARVTVFDPDLDLGHPASASSPQVLVTARAVSSVPPQPLVLTTRCYERDVPGVKHLGLFATVFHRRQAQLAGFDDVLFVDREGFISEGATWNVGLIEGDDIVWPQAPVLPGVAMALIRQERPGHERRVNVAELDRYTAAFATNATVGVRAVTAIDAIRWSGMTPLVEQIRKDYSAIPGEPL